jgi:hypothetical protein
MKQQKVYQLLAVIFALLPVLPVYGLEDRSFHKILSTRVCFSDSPSDFKVVLAPTQDEKAYVSKMESMVNAQYVDWLAMIAKRQRINDRDLRLLRHITIKVSSSHNSLGSIRGAELVIDEGNLVVGYAMAYSWAKAWQQKVSARALNLWSDYFFDSIIQGDPIVYVDGTNEFIKFINSQGGLDEELRRVFLQTLRSWIALTIFHEAAHHLLDHDKQWRTRFPNIDSTNMSAWRDEEFKFSRALEIDADRKALELYIVGAGYDPRQVLVSWTTWQVARREALRNFVVFPTHPDPVERGTTLVRNLASLLGIPDDVRDPLISLIVGFGKGISERLRHNGRLQPVPTIFFESPQGISSEPPLGLSPNMQRYYGRTTQLQILKERFDAGLDEPAQIDR